MSEGEPRIPLGRNPSHGEQIPDMSGEEAIAIYRAWRKRVIGEQDTRAHTMVELFAQLREPEGHH